MPSVPVQRKTKALFPLCHLGSSNAFDSRAGPGLGWGGGGGGGAPTRHAISTAEQLQQGIAVLSSSREKYSTSKYPDRNPLANLSRAAVRREKIKIARLGCSTTDRDFVWG